MKTLLCVDPGPETSGVVRLGYEEGCFPTIELSSYNERVEATLVVCVLYRYCGTAHLVIEGIQNMGMPAGADVFETAEVIGRIRQAFGYENTTKIYRSEVKIALCGSMRAKDANVRRAIIDMFPPTGGGRIPQIGTKNKPGPLYGVKGHAWSALAVGLTYLKKQQ